MSERCLQLCLLAVILLATGGELLLAVRALGG